MVNGEKNPKAQTIVVVVLVLTVHSLPHISSDFKLKISEVLEVFPTRQRCRTRLFTEIRVTQSRCNCIILGLIWVLNILSR